VDTIDPEAPNLLHSVSRKASWSRANEKGVFPGIATPLNWSIWGETGERCVRRAAFDLGLLDADEVDPPGDVDLRSWSIFYGRPTANVDTWRRLHVGLSASDQAQRQVFGDAPSDAAVASDVASRERIARQRARMMPIAAEGMARARRELEAWWREATSPAALAEPEHCRRTLAEGLDGFARADHFHILVSMLSMEAITALTLAAERARRPEAANEMMIGYPGMEEFETTAALFEVSRGEATLEAFLDEHGFHGSQEGEIASASWREDPTPVRALLERYAALDASEDPRRREAGSVARRESLEAMLREATPKAERKALDAVFAQAETFLPLREAGRATLTIALDGMRGAARTLSRSLAEAGVLPSPGDVFLATHGELLDPPADLRARIEARRALRACYAAFELPEAWQGMPEKQPLTAAMLGETAAAGQPLAPGDSLEGLGASHGLHEGTARVVLDPNALDEDFAPGDVLVAPATDPSWATLFLIAGAVVIDTGSNFSHAAIVAREMGIPAVVAAPEASRRLQSGTRLRVDGQAGRVEVLAAAD
jgi:pyruvate,water dikinase